MVITRENWICRLIPRFGDAHAALLHSLLYICIGCSWVGSSMIITRVGLGNSDFILLTDMEGESMLWVYVGITFVKLDNKFSVLK